MRVLGVIAVLFAYTAITSYQLIGGGDILSLIFPTTISPDFGKYIIAAFVIVFTAIAGMSSVAYMDVVIGMLATITMLIAFPVLTHAAGGWSAVTHALPATHFQVLGDDSFIQAMELFLPSCLLMLGNQSMYQKFFSAKSERDAWKGVESPAPFVLLAQPTLFDPSRAPAGKHTAWGYCHVPNGSTKNMSAAIETQIERFAPGFRARILQRSVMLPSDLQAHNPNLAGGDVEGGAVTLSQLFTRPTWRLHATTDPRIYICSASTPPGGGVHGLCGHLAAKRALRR